MTFEKYHADLRRVLNEEWTALYKELAPVRHNYQAPRMGE
jgi:hypothetical protein